MGTRRVRGVGAAALSALLVLAAVAGAVPRSEAVPIDPSKAQFVGGEVGDATCNVEEVQSANEHQLHEILAELTNTTYFRLFPVDLNRPCKFWNKPDAEAGAEEAQTCSAAPPDTSAVAGGFADAGTSAAFGESAPEPPTMCSLDLASESATAAKWADTPTTPVDTTISTHEHRSLEGSAPEDEACAEDRPEFWLDMCEGGGHGASASASAEHVNLQLNPEGWTGYNGSHVWEAIYHENCLRGVSDPDDMCYEERVLYRLLSGMHASVNTHIALKAKPPRRNTPGREVWSPDPARFQRMYGEHPDRLRNMHFSFVVLLRALRKASDALAQMDVALGHDPDEDARTAALLRRLLDTHILSSCSGVFGAFDESALFSAVAEEMGAGKEAVDDVGAPESLASLKSQFKGVFRNISDVMDCVSCQKCKLHGKLQLLGLGTALKVLLLPEDMHAAALSRAEIIAFINTAAKFSHAILKAPELASAAARQEAGRDGDDGAEAAKTLSANARTSAEDARPAVPPAMKDASEAKASPRALSAAETKGEEGETPDGRRADAKVGADSAPAGDEKTSDLIDKAVRATASLAEGGSLSATRESALLDALFAGDPRVLALARYYDGAKFVERALRVVDAREARNGEPSREVTSLEATTPEATIPEVTRLEATTPEPTPEPTPELTPTPLASGGGVDEHADAVVVGGGLAGLTAALTLLDRGARVILLEKEAFAGGNSQWASSGINGVNVSDPANPDSIAAFREDCEKSSLGGGAGSATGATLESNEEGVDERADVPPAPESIEHVAALAEGSAATLEWFKTRVGVDLNQVGQLGGHSHARTHRPASGMAGSVLVTATQKACDAYAERGAFVMRRRARATEIVVGADGATRGVRWLPVAKRARDDAENVTRVSDENVLHAVAAPAVILATGGFAGDREGANSLLRAHAPRAASFATTNTAGTTGDGHKMALSLGAAAVDMSNVQIHPTGFVDPKDPVAPTKTLAAEILRGAGGLLLTRDGRRFVDELGTRDYVSGRMLAEARAEAEAGGEPMHEGHSLTFALLLNARAAAEAEKHVALYVAKGLLERVQGVARVAAWLKRELGGGQVANAAARAHRGKRTVEAALRDTLRAYDASAVRATAETEANANGTARFACPLTNKTRFAGAPFLGERTPGVSRDASFAMRETFYVGRVTPVTHYTMGGVRVDDDGRVVRNEARAAKTGQSVVPGLFAAGELVGGVHGKNRLGGNALTECAVFGRRVGLAVPLPPRDRDDPDSASDKASDLAADSAATVTRAELARHASAADCWVALYGEVYDLTDFAEDHPAGAEAITRFAGTDGTRGFDAVHSPEMLEEFEALGTLVD